jgi:hypothetical protein
VDRVEHSALHDHVKQAQPPRSHVDDPSKRHLDPNSTWQMSDPANRIKTEPCRLNAEVTRGSRDLKRGHEKGSQGDDDRSYNEEQWNKPWTPEPDTARSDALVNYR